MAKQISKPAAWAQYLLVRAIAGFLRLLPLPVAVVLGRAVGWCLYTFDKRHRYRCIEAMQNALGYDREKADALTRAMYRHFGTMIAEFPRSDTLNEANVDSIVDWGTDLDRLREILSEGKGAILVSGHIGNWEITGQGLAIKGVSAGAVARPLDNPLLDGWIRRMRESHGHEIWDKKGAMRSALRVLKEGRAFGILNDQDGGKDGEFVKFFGLTASTVAAAADLAVRTGAPLVISTTHRIAPMRFDFSIEEEVRPDPDAPDRKAELRRVLQLVNDRLEAAIMRAPEQWTWMHRRWKTQPRAVPVDNVRVEGNQ